MPRTDCRKLLLLLQNIGAAAYPQPRCTVYASFLSVCNTFSTCLHPNIHVYLCWGARHQKATQSNTCCALVVLLQIHSQAAPVSLLCALSATLFEVLVPVLEVGVKNRPISAMGGEMLHARVDENVTCRVSWQHGQQTCGTRNSCK